MEIITNRTRKVYDAVIVGSGAAGGMAAYVMARRDESACARSRQTVRSIQRFQTHAWPYEDPHRGRIPRSDAHNYKYGFVDGYTSHIYARLDENHIRRPVTSRSTGCGLGRLEGAPRLGGRVSLRFSDYDFKAKTHAKICRNCLTESFKRRSLCFAARRYSNAGYKKPEPA
ncbi:MAG: hypothetical protein IPJ07_26895 [Acidobacteria bacterium]|nr:hypothetical protein [Acidobacteriota bacterium]